MHLVDCKAALPRTLQSPCCCAVHHSCCSGRWRWQFGTDHLCHFFRLKSEGSINLIFGAQIERFSPVLGAAVRVSSPCERRCDGGCLLYGQQHLLLYRSARFEAVHHVFCCQVFFRAQVCLLGCASAHCYMNHTPRFQF